jgi:hypothetical protein
VADGHPCVEDFDRTGCPADVTYCPKSNFAPAEAPVGRFDLGIAVGFHWHSDCSSSLQAARQRPHSDKNKKSDNTPPQTSKQATNEPRQKRGFFFIATRRVIAASNHAQGHQSARGT